MQIIRFTDNTAPDEPVYGVLDGGEVLTLEGDFAAPRTGERVAVQTDITLLSPCDPRVIVCAGANYASQLAERRRPFPEEPSLFLKSTNTVIGPTDAMHYGLEYEGELAVVIGRMARDVREEDFAEVVLGYTCANDVTASDWRADGQWTRAKSLDTFCPLGPWIETSIDDPSALRLKTRLNGAVVQECGTDDMIFDVPKLIAWITRWITLRPGDVVLTASPSGVGPMVIGDSIEIDAIGPLTNIVCARSAR